QRPSIISSPAVFRRDVICQPFGHQWASPILNDRALFSAASSELRRQGPTKRHVFVPSLAVIGAKLTIGSPSSAANDGSDTQIRHRSCRIRIDLPLLFLVEARLTRSDSAIRAREAGAARRACFLSKTISHRPTTPENLFRDPCLHFDV